MGRTFILVGMEPRRAYDPCGTREALLDAAYEAMVQVGYRGMSLDQVIAAAGVTKGALYHPFRHGKRALGEMVLERRIRPAIESRWIEPLRAPGDPIDSLQSILRVVTEEDAGDLAVRGSPINNLAQEMSAAEPFFQERIERLYAVWLAAIAEALRQGQRDGTVRENLDPHATATVVVAQVEGASGLAKATRDPAVVRTCVEGLGHYLEALRPRRGFRG